MKPTRIVAFTVMLLSMHVLAQMQEPPAHHSSSQVIDYWVTLEEHRLVGVAEAMPADKYPFIPSNGEFKGTRSFAGQLKHAAATNFILAAAILGDNPPADAGDETGPDTLRTKEDVIQYLKHSFAYLHKAAATIDESNAGIAPAPISPMPKGSATRLGYAIEALMHGYDHYGQLVEYLRMNNIVPPASRFDAGRAAGTPSR
jgi:DinB superfamily